MVFHLSLTVLRHFSREGSLVVGLEYGGEGLHPAEGSFECKGGPRRKQSFAHGDGGRKQREDEHAPKTWIACPIAPSVFCSNSSTRSLFCEAHSDELSSLTPIWDCDQSLVIILPGYLAPRRRSGKYYGTDVVMGRTSAACDSRVELKLRRLWSAPDLATCHTGDEPFRTSTMQIRGWWQVAHRRKEG